MRKSIIQTLKFLAFLFTGIILLWIAFKNVDFKSLKADLEEADYYWLILSVLFGFLAYLSRTRRWMLLIHPLGFRPAFWNTFHGLMTGYLANIALPRIGEITRCVALGKKEKIPVDQLVGTVVVERTIDFISLLILTIVIFLTSGVLIKEFLKENIIEPVQSKLAGMPGITWIIWLTLIVILVSVMILMMRYRKHLRHIRFFSKMFDVAKGVINGLKTITGLERKWEFVFHTFFIWLNYALMTWVVVFAIPSTSHLSFWNSIFILVVGGLAMSAPVQGGFGAFHYLVSRGMAFIEGVSLEDGLVYAILTHESQLLFVIIVGAVSFFLIFRKHNKRKPV